MISLTAHQSDNAFLAVDDVAALQAAADKLSAEIIRKRLDYSACVPWGRTSARARMTQRIYEALIQGNEMSVDIAAALRHEAKIAQAVAERQSNRQDKTELQQLATKLIEIAERLERDARD